jgi:hypothetical protein
VSGTSRGTKRHADTVLSGLLKQVVKGHVPPGHTTTLSDYLEQGLDHITPSRSTTTIRGYRLKIKRISAKRGHVRLDKLTAQHLDRAYRDWLDEGFDPSIVHHLHRVLSAAALKPA